MNSYLNQSTQQTNSVLDQINKLKRMNELGYDGYMASIAQHQKPVEAIKPAYANPEPSVKPQTEALKALTAEQLFSPVVAEPVSETNQTPEENGYWGNIARGIGERATQLVGHGAGLVGQVADLSLQGWGDLLGYTYAYNAEKDDWEWIEREEYKRLKDEGLATSVLDGAGATFTKGAEALQNADLGYEEKYGWHSTKEIWNDANASLLGKIGHTLSAGVEQGLKSIPDMVAVASNPALLGAYIGARAHEIGEQRAINDGKDPSEATLTDTVVALPFAGASALTEKIATQALLKGAGNAVKGMGGGALKTIGTATAREGIQETVQESIEYAGESALTQKGWQEDQAKDRALAGAVLGSVFGGVMGTGQAGIKASHDASNIYHQGDMAKDAEELKQASQNFSDYGVSVTQSSPAEQASEAGKEALKAEITGERPAKFDPKPPAGEPFKRTEATANNETVQEAPIDRPEVKKVVGKKSEVYTDNAVQPVTLEIVEASDLEASTKISDNQPRNRDSEASRAQIQAIANDLRPRRLADTDDLATGAPVISRKGGAVIAGNGRLSAIQLAYKNQNEGSQKYKDYLIEHAEDFGMQSADIKEFNQPVLIRRFNHDVDIQRTAINSNSEGTLKMSMLENAQADAKLLPDLSALKFQEILSNNKGNNHEQQPTRPVTQSDGNQSTNQASDGGSNQANNKQPDPVSAVIQKYGTAKIIEQYQDYSNEEVKSFEEEADRWKEIQKEIQNEYQQAKQNPSVSRSELKYLKEMKEWVDGTVLLTENGLRFYRENQKFKLANPATDENIDDLLNEEAEQDFAQSDLNQYTLDELLGEDNNNFTDDDIANNLKGLYSVPPLTQDYEWEHGQRKGLFDLPNIQIVKLTGNEFGTTELKELQEKANEHLKQFREGGLFNRDTGWDLRITSDDRKKITGWGKVGISGRQAQFAIKEIVERAVLAESHQDEKHNNPDVVGIHRLYAPVEIAGILYRARLTVRDYQYYDPKRADTLRLHSVETIELEKAPMGTLGQNQSPAPQPTSALHEMSIRDLLQGSKRHNGTNWVMDSNLLYSVPPFNPSEFIQSAKQKIKDFVSKVKNDKTIREQVDLNPVSEAEIIEALKHGIDLNGFIHMIDSSAINHIIKNHGNETTEKSRGNIAINENDFQTIPDVISNPDLVVYGGKTNIGREAIFYIKRLDDSSMLVVEEVRTGKRKLALTSLRKVPPTVHATSLVKSLNLNAQSGFGGDNIIVVEKPFNGNYSISPNNETNKKADPEKTEALLKRLLGKRAEHIQIHHSGRNQQQSTAEGAHYRKGNQTTHIYMEAINPFRVNGEEVLSQEERTVWVAWHELFHRGGTAYGMEKLRATLKDAKRNRLVRHIANEKIKQYAEQNQQLDEETAIEEALAELEAGLRLGRMDAIVKQYGQNLKNYNFIQNALIEVGRVVNKIIRRFMGSEKELSNQEVFDLIRGVSERSGDELVIHKEIKLIEYKPNNQFPAVIHQTIKTNEQTGETLLIEYQPSTNYPVVISEQMKNISPELKMPAYNQELAQAIREINSGKAIDAKNFDVVMPYFNVLNMAQQNQFIRQLLDDLPTINQEKIDLNQKPLIINGLANLKTYQPTPFEHIQHKGFKNKRGNSLYSLAPTEEFIEAVDEINNGRRPRSTYRIHLGNTPDVLRMLGLPNVDVSITEKVIAKVMGDRLNLSRTEYPSTHNLTADDVKRLPQQLNNPIAVMRSDENSSNPDGYIVLTELVERKNNRDVPVIASLFLKNLGNDLEVIRITSAYGKENLRTLNDQINRNLLYWNNRKGLNFLSTFGLQLSANTEERLSSLSENIKTEADLSQYQRNNNPLLSIAPEQSFSETEKKYGGESAYLEAKQQGKTELTYRQWVQVRTPEFKAWFGDWEDRKADSSMVINPKTKEPLVVRHFTGDNFTVFDDTKADGFWFTDKKELDDEVGAFSSDNVIEVFLNVREPITGTPNYDIKDFFADNPEYDGGINSYEGNNGEFTDYVVINPNQIKSATDNIGSFNENNNSILYSLEPVEPSRFANSFDGARALLEPLVNTEIMNEATGMVATISKKTIDKMLSSKAHNKSSSLHNHLLAVSNVDELFKKSILGWSHNDKRQTPEIIQIHRFFAPFNIAGKLELVKLTIKELSNNQGNRIYSVETLEIVNEKSPVPEMTDADAQFGIASHRHNGAMIDSLVEFIQKYNAQQEYLNLSDNDLLSDVDSNQPLFSLPPSREVVQKEVAETVIKMGGQKGWRISGTNLKYKDWIDAHTPSFQNYLSESGNELTPELMADYKNGLLGLDEIAEALLSLPNYVPPSVQTKSQQMKATFKKLMGGDLAQKWLDRQIYLDELAEKGGKLAELVRNSFKNFNARSQNQLKKDLMPIHEALKNELGQAFNRFKSLDRYKDFSDAKGMEQFLLDLDQIGKYVFHGLERNQYIKQKTNGKDEAGSGLTDDEIKLAIQTFNSAEYGNGKLIRYYDQLYKNHLRKFIDYSDKVLSQAGLLTQPMKANRPNYQYYVPLFGDANSEEDGTIRVGSGQKTDNLKNRNHSAEGRHGTEADNLFANIYLQAETAVKRAQMQESKRRLLDMALDPNGKVLLGASVQKTTGWRNPHADEIVYQDGQDFYYISIRNKKALEAMKDFNALPFVNNGILETPFAWAYDKQSRLSKFMASTYTRWNPNFIFRNKIMDSFQQWQLLLADAPVGQMTQANGLKGYAEALKNVGGRFGLAKKAMAYNIKWTAKGGKDTEYQRLLARYAELGGVTTYASFLGRDSLFNLQEEAITATRGKFDPRRYSQVLSKTFDGLNNYLELTTRISAFKALLDYGVDEETAMNYVKNVMNFETKGDYARHLGNFYPFFTTALYDARRTIKALKTKEGQVVLAGLIGFVLSVQALIASVTGEDDDGVAWVDKYNMAKSARGFIIPMTSDDGVMRGEGIIIPFGFGLGRLAGVLANSTRRLANGAEDGADFTSNLVNHALIGGFSPIHPSDTNLMKDPSAWVLNTFLPQTIKPLVQHSQNKNYQGKAIYADERFRSTGELDHNSGFFWTADTYQITAKALYDYLGVDVAPESLAFFVSNYLGGIGQTGVNIAENALDYVVGEGNQSVASWYHQVPILGGFTQQAPNIDRHRYLTQMEKARNHYNQVVHDAQSGTLTQADNQKIADAIWWHELYKQQNKQIMAINKQLKEARKVLTGEQLQIAERRAQALIHAIHIQVNQLERQHRE